MPTYNKASKTIVDRLKRVIREHDMFKPIVKAKVTFNVLVAHPDLDKHGLPKGPTIKVGGYPCAAVISKTNAKQRAAGLKDVMIIIDTEWWEAKGRKSRERDALLAHELRHIDVDTEETGKDGRPKIQMRLHDMVLGGFRCIVDAYGVDAAEAVELRCCVDEYVDDQLKFNFQK